MRTLISLTLLLLTILASSPHVTAQDTPSEPIPDYNELFDAVFGQVQAASSSPSTLPIANTLIEPYQNLASGGYGFLVDWDPGDDYPYGTILHPALDYNLGGGTADADQPVVAAGPGKIAYAGWLSTAWGGVVAEQIRLRGGEQIWLFTAHLGINGIVPAGIGSDVTAHDDIFVQTNQIVGQGETLGLLARGAAYGTLQEVAWESHLHWEIRHIDHNRYNVGLWPGHNQPLSAYLSHVVHPAKFIASYNSSKVRLYEGIYLAYDAYDAISRPYEWVEADPRRQTPAYEIGLHNLPDGFDAHSMIVPDGTLVVVYSEVDGLGTPRAFTNPVMDFDNIGELNRNTPLGKSDTDRLGFQPKSVQVFQLPMASTEPTPTATSTQAPTSTSTPTPTSTGAPTFTPSPTIIPTSTPIPTDTPTSPPTKTPSPTSTNRPMPTAMPTSTSVPSSTVTPTRTLIPTATATNTPVPTATPTSTDTPSPTTMSTSTPTLPNTPLPTNTPTTIPTNTSIPTATETLVQNVLNHSDLHEDPNHAREDEIDGGTAQLPPCNRQGTACLPAAPSHMLIFMPLMVAPTP